MYPKTTKLHGKAAAVRSDRLAVFASATFTLFANGRQWRQPHESWSRCSSRYGLKPDHDVALEGVSETEYKRRADALSPVLSLVAPEMQSLFMAIKGSGYSLGFVDPDGVTITHQQPDPASRDNTSCKLGAIWTEEIHGTNSAGTCLIERVPVAFLGEDHFCNNIKHLVCASAPIFDWNGTLLGALDVSAEGQLAREAVHRVIFDVVQAAGVRMEDRLFAAHFSNRSVLSIYGDSGGCAMLALDDDEYIIGLNRFAAFALPENALGQKIWDLLDRPIAVTSGSTEDRANLDFRLYSARAAVTSTVHGNLARAWVKRRAARLPENSRTPLEQVDRLERYGGADPQLNNQIQFIRKVKDTTFPILLMGETGTGKSVLAQAIHCVSNRSARPFVAFNCAAIPETLIDSELFGYGSGAFTGARREGSEGIIAAAHGGTLFLDEIGDMPLAQQTRLLRVLESGEIIPLGTGKVRKLDVRVIAATNANLHECVRAGTFRSDLLYRLAGLVVNIPPLRERTDFEAIAKTILAENQARSDLLISPAALDFLSKHSWPGNIRELRNVLVRAAYLAPGNVIHPEDIFLLPCPSDEAAFSTPPRTVRGATDEAERVLINRTLTECSGDVSRAAQKMGISRATLYRKIKRYRDLQEPAAE